MIKRLVGYVCAGLLTVAHAQVPAAHVYDLHATSQHRPAASSSDLVSPETARLILAQRLGLSQYHSLKGVDEQTMWQLNDFGGSPQRLLSNDYGDLGLGKLLVIIEGVQNPTRKHSAPAKKYRAQRVQTADANSVQISSNHKMAYLRCSESQTRQFHLSILNY